MLILNLACNGHRPTQPFINIDILRTFLLPGTPERTNLDKERNYIEADLLKGIPMPAESCEGVFMSHFLEHLDAQESVRLIADCKRVLKPDGLLVISVPDATYFRKVYHRDCQENSKELFGEPIMPSCKTFFDWALFLPEHKQILTEDALWSLMVKGGFPNSTTVFWHDSEVFRLMHGALNRPKFSLVMWAVK